MCTMTRQKYVNCTTLIRARLDYLASQYGTGRVANERLRSVRDCLRSRLVPISAIQPCIHLSISLPPIWRYFDIDESDLLCLSYFKFSSHVKQWILCTQLLSCRQDWSWVARCWLKAWRTNFFSVVLRLGNMRAPLYEMPPCCVRSRAKNCATSFLVNFEVRWPI